MKVDAKKMRPDQANDAAAISEMLMLWARSESTLKPPDCAVFIAHHLPERSRYVLLENMSIFVIVNLGPQPCVLCGEYTTRRVPSNAPGKTAPLCSDCRSRSAAPLMARMLQFRDRFD